jgi:hypothetical protein
VIQEHESQVGRVVKFRRHQDRLSGAALRSCANHSGLTRAYPQPGRINPPRAPTSVDRERAGLLQCTN